MTVRKVRKLEELRENLILVPGVLDIFNKVIMMIIMITLVKKVTQHIPTSQIPTRWESDIMMKGGNMTQSNSHHTHI